MGMSSKKQAIVEALTAQGCDVQSLESLDDFPADFLVGREGSIFLLKVDDEPVPRWHALLCTGWESRISIVCNADEALEAVGLMLERKLRRLVEEMIEETAKQSSMTKEEIEQLIALGGTIEIERRGRTCQQCGKPLTAKRKDAKYCGTKCRKAASRKRAQR